MNNNEKTPRNEKDDGEDKEGREVVEPKLTSKAFNATFLMLCFGFAAYSILSVDEGMTRGWSMAEKGKRKKYISIHTRLYIVMHIPKHKVFNVV